MKLKQVVGLLVATLGLIFALFGAYVLTFGKTVAFDQAVNRWEALVPLILGLVFLGSGLSVLRSV